MSLQVTPPALSTASLLLIGGNAVPLFGVFLWGWDVFEIMFLYWSENIVIGAMTILAMVVIGGREGSSGLAGAAGMGAFFTVHYGMFCMGHGVFVFALFYPGDTHALENGGLFAPLTFLLQGGLWQGFIWAFAGIVIVQLIQLIEKWPRLNGQDFGKVMMAPYGRIVVLHLTLIFGGMLAEALGQPAGALVFLIVLKTAFDLGFITLMHRQPKAERDNGK